MLSVVGVSSIGALVFSDRPALAAQTPAVISGNATASISYKCLTFSLRGDLNAMYILNLRNPIWRTNIPFHL